MKSCFLKKIAKKFNIEKVPIEELTGVTLKDKVTVFKMKRL